MTPYELGIMLHYYCRSGDAEDLRAPIGMETVDKMIAADLLARNGPHGDASFRITARGAFYVRAILALPLPVQRWEIPQSTGAVDPVGEKVTGGPRA